MIICITSIVVITMIMCITIIICIITMCRSATKRLTEAREETLMIYMLKCIVFKLYKFATSILSIITYTSVLLHVVN